MYNWQSLNAKLGDLVQLRDNFLAGEGLDKYITSDVWCNVLRVDEQGIIDVEIKPEEDYDLRSAIFRVHPIYVKNYRKYPWHSLSGYGNTDDLVYRVKSYGEYGVNDFDVFRKFIKDMKDSIESTSFETITKEMVKTYVDKNHDYGNSFNKSMDEFGVTAAVVRMSDKMERLKTLSKTDAKVADEKIEDTLLDLANYAVMTVMYLRSKKNGKAEQK